MLKFMIFLCLILCFIFQGVDSSCFLFNSMEVHVYNDLPENTLFVHCKSKDDDLGIHYVKPKQDYNFSFCYKPYVTLFTCHVQWGKNTVSFQAYNGKWFSKSPCAPHECKWAAEPDGLYLQGIKKYDWQQ